MREVGTYDAKTRLPELLRDVANGERVRITRRGYPVAILGPAEVARPDPAGVVAEIRRLGRRYSRLW